MVIRFPEERHERYRPTRPTELLRLRSATTACLEVVRDLESWAHQTADVNRIVNPEFASQLDWLRDELRTAQLAHESGTPAAIARVVGELLGEE